MDLRAHVSYNLWFFPRVWKIAQKISFWKVSYAFVKLPKSKLTKLLPLNLLHTTENLKLH